MHGRRVRNVQDDRRKFAQKFAQLERGSTPALCSGEASEQQGPSLGRCAVVPHGAPGNLLDEGAKGVPRSSEVEPTNLVHVELVPLQEMLVRSSTQADEQNPVVVLVSRPHSGVRMTRSSSNCRVPSGRITTRAVAKSRACPPLTRSIVPCTVKWMTTVPELRN
jgi:hypothetical protein